MPTNRVEVAGHKDWCWRSQNPGARAKPLTLDHVHYTAYAPRWHNRLGFLPTIPPTSSLHLRASLAVTERMETVILVLGGFCKSEKVRFSHLFWHMRNSQWMALYWKFYDTKKVFPLSLQPLKNCIPSSKKLGFWEEASTYLESVLFISSFVWACPCSSCVHATWVEDAAVICINNYRCSCTFSTTLNPRQDCELLRNGRAMDGDAEVPGSP